MRKFLDVYVVMTIFLLFAAVFYFILSVNAEINERKISSINVADDNSYVKFTGIVKSPPTFYIEAGIIRSVHFKIDDGTGEATVRMYYPLAKEAYLKGNIPSLGDSVDVSGILSVTEKTVSLTIYNLSDLKYRQREPIETSIDRIKNLSELSVVSIKGRVVEINAYSFGYKIIVADIRSKQTINVTVPNYYKIPEISKLSHSEVLVTGAVRYYRGVPEIIPRIFDGIKIKEVVEFVSISDLANLSLYMFVEAVGYVEFVIASDSYQVFILKIGEERINVFVEWGAQAERVWQGLKVRVRGIIVVYEGEFEIKVRGFSEDVVEVLEW